MALTKLTANVNNIQALSDRPNELDGLTIDELLKYLPGKKYVMDALQSRKKEIKESDLYADDYLKPFENEETFLEYALKNNISIKAHNPTTIRETILYLKYNKRLSYLNEKLLYEKVNDNELLIDLLMKEKKYLTIRESVKKDLRVMNYCVKYNYYNIINESILNELFASINETNSGSSEIPFNNFPSIFFFIFSNFLLRIECVLKIIT